MTTLQAPIAPLRHKNASYVKKKLLQAAPAGSIIKILKDCLAAAIFSEAVFHLTVFFPEPAKSQGSILKFNAVHTVYSTLVLEVCHYESGLCVGFNLTSDLT